MIRYGDVSEAKTDPKTRESVQVSGAEKRRKEDGEQRKEDER
jgi:hypothetical protein